MSGRSARRVVAGCSVSALVAGLLWGAVVPGASAVESVDLVSGDVAGIESVGPVATVGASGGQRWPGVPVSVAVMPSGSVLSGAFPLLRVPALESVASIDFRVVDLRSDRRLVEAQGTLVSGWATVGASLPAGGLYDVEVSSEGVWSRVGSFSVAVAGTEPGPPLSVGGISVSTVTGLASTGWTSRPLVGPVSSAGVALSWVGGVASTPGLPEGWRLTVASGSPWSGVFSDGELVEAVDVPGQPVAVRSKPASGEGSSARVKKRYASVSFAYPADERAEVDGFVVQTKVAGAGWKTQRRTGVSFAEVDVNARVRVPVKGAVRVRVGVVAEGVTVFGPSSRVFNDGRQPVQAVRPVTSGDLRGAGENSVVTPGELPNVVTVTGWDGSRLSFVRNALGVYDQTGGTAGFRNSLTRDAGGAWELTDTQGVVTRFESGRAVSVTMDGKVMTRIGWDSSGRVTSVTNEIGRQMTLRWAGGGECVSDSWTQYGFASVPDGYLCAIEYPYGQSELIGYVQAGDGVQVGLIKSPGNEGVTWGWDTAGRVVSTRSALVSQVATSDPSVAGVIATVSYDDQGRAFRLTEQAASVGGSSLSSVIEFPVVSEGDLRAWSANPGASAAVAGRVRVAGLVGVDNFQTTLFDPISWQPVQVSSSEGAQMGKILSPTGGVAGMRDAVGRVSRSQTNELGLVTRSEGPSTSGAGMVVQRDYDTEFVNGQDKALVGLRAQVYPRVGFAGNPTSAFWRADSLRGGLSASWSGQGASSSVQAAGVWTPGDAADQAGSKRGWQLEVSSSPGAQVSVLVGSQPCSGRTCVITGVPTGPKAITVQVDQAGSAGWFSVNVAPVGQAPAPVNSDEVAPGFALGTKVTNNDTLPGAPDGSITRYAFADPASGQVTSMTSSGGQTGRITYETTGWKRAVSMTTTGGGTKRMTYWGDNETATLPGVCGGGQVLQSGQVKSVTRQDGSAITNYFDQVGQLRASVVTDTTGGVAQTSCMTYLPGGTVDTEAIYDASGALIESAQTILAVNGDPRTAAVRITHGPAAPVSPGATVTESTTVDLAGRVVSSTDITGVVSEATYDNTGALTRMTITPPAGSGVSSLVFDYTYRANDGLLLSTKVNGVTAASYTYDGATTRIAAVDYADGVRTTFGYGPDGRADSLTVTTPNEEFTRITQSRSASSFGRVEGARLTVTGTAARTENRGYTFDAAGRLTKAIIATTSNDTAIAGRRVFDYAFAATQAGTCGAGYAKPGADNLRTGGTRDGATFTQCYDTGGRMVSTTDPYVTGGEGTSNVDYDALGRVTRITGPRAAALTWSAGTQIASVAEISADQTSLVRTTMDTYGGQLLDKTLTTDTGSTTLRYAGPFLLNITDGQITGTQAISYAIGVGGRVTTAPGTTATLTLPGLDGSALVTINVPSLGSGNAPAPGETVGLADRYAPYGEPLVTPNPADANVMPDYGWAAGAGLETLPGTSAITLMGARPYSPYLGVFLAPDPVVDSGTNLYSYTLGDPINTSDTSGRLTDEELGGILAGAGIAAAVLGGYVAGRLGTALKVKINLTSDTAAQAARYSWGAARAVDVAGGLVAVAGVGAAGYGTYIAVKSATDSALGAGFATAGAVLLSAYAGYASFVTGTLLTGLGKLSNIKAESLGQKWSVGQYYNPVKVIRKVVGKARQGATGRAGNASDRWNTQEINDLLAPRNSSQSGEVLLLRSQVTVKSEKLLPSPVKTNLSQKANAFMHESSSSEGSLRHVAGGQVDAHASVLSNDEFTQWQQFLLKQVYKNM